MRVVDFISQEDIVPEMTASEKTAALRELAATLAVRHALDRDGVFEVLVEREKLASTGIGEGVAIPHGKLAAAPRLCAVLGRSRAGVEFDSIDGRHAHLFFALVAPENSAGLHLKALARISRLLKDRDLRQRLLAAANATEMWSALGEEDART